MNAALAPVPSGSNAAPAGGDAVRVLRVLYIAYWGALEPLGQSQLLPAVRRLAASGARLTLITFEKPRDLDDRAGITATRASLAEHGVRWIPLRYHKRPKLAVTLFDVAHGITRSIAARANGRFDIVHARTFVGGLIGAAVARALRAKLVFHGEGFYPDEQADGGVWRNGSIPHRVARALESGMYSGADAIIAMSFRGKDIIERLPAVRQKTIPVIVAPACPHPAFFAKAAALAARSALPDTQHDTLRMVYLGSIGYRYMLDAIARFLTIAARAGGRARLRILSHSDAHEIAATLDRAGAPRELWTLETVPHAAVPAELAGHHAGLMFLARGSSSAGVSPTKVGEYWACGLPVVATPDIGDIDDIIRRERVGIVLEGHTDDDYARAVEELRQLVKDPDLRDRCRRAAARHYAMAPACDRQIALYRALAFGTRPDCTRRGILT